MSVISIFSGTFCKEGRIIRELINKTGYGLIGDTDIISQASTVSGIASNKMERVFSSKTSVFNRFTHEKERSLAHLKLILAGVLRDDNLIIEGFSGQLIPRNIDHVLRVCLIADMPFRLATAEQEQALPQAEAAKVILKHDEDRASWILNVCGKNDPWDPSLYDILIPMDKTPLEEVSELIMENLRKDVVSYSETSKQRVEDFLLAANVEVVLAKEGHNVEVHAKEGVVTLTINKHVLMLNRLEEELRSIASQVSEVKSVKTKVGPGFHQTDIYRRYDFDVPSKVLLVDDEREFVQTLSERLLMRDMGSAVAYDGESALEMIKEDEPEVMILDLRMPGIDGIEVLRRVKETQSDIEVIILTGHGSEADKKTCMDLGAFAYLQKPVDIDELSRTIKKANERIREKKE
jgi:two-component system response regulator CpxR